MIPWRARLDAELVVHDLGFLLDEDRGQPCRSAGDASAVQGRVGDRILDDPVGELVAGLVERVALEALPDLVAERVEVS